MLSLPSWECGLKSIYSLQSNLCPQSLPSWECGLKFTNTVHGCILLLVTPFVGVWIEIKKSVKMNIASESLPSWECGLKYHSSPILRISAMVTPFVGVWIEICRNSSLVPQCSVTPFVGVWIEISKVLRSGWSNRSLPSWECGLK